MREKLTEAIRAALQGLGVAVAEVSLEHPADLKNGDYATGVALQYAKQAGMKPRELAEKIVAAMGAIEGIAKIEIAGPGFINFYLSNETLSEAISLATHKSDLWGRNPILAGKKIMVEYTDPNPFKEFHIGHLMSNAIGESLSRLLQYSGAEMKRANYQGDIGPHVAKAIWALLKKGNDSPTVGDIGDAYTEGARAYEDDPATKAKIDEINKKIYEKTDAQINAFYEHGRKISLEHFEELYDILGTKFDFYFFESETGPRGVQVVRAHPEIFIESEGAVVFKGERHGLHTRVFLNKQGLPTYEAKDLGLAEMKKEKAVFDASITVTASEQSDYFKVVLKALELVHPEWAGQFQHVAHGMMRFAEGKMSSRKGNVVTGESLLNELIEAAKERAKESRAGDPHMLAQQVAVAAIKYQILKQASGHDIIFDRDRALSLEGDSGPYLQYAHARADAIVEKANAQGVSLGVRKGDSLSISENAVMFARLLHRFPEVIERAAREREPHLVANYLIEIASRFNGWYAREQILDGTPAAPHKAALTDAVRATLKNGLWILGIPAPEKM